MPDFAGTSVVACVAFYAKKTPDKTALIVGDVGFTYGELWRNIQFCADELSQRSVKKACSVLLHATHSFSYVVGYLAVTLLGAIAVPYEESMPDAAVCALSKATDAVCVVSDVPVAGGKDLFSVTDILADARKDQNRLYDSHNFPASADLAEFLLTTGTTGASKIVMLTHGAIMAQERNIIDATLLKSDNVSLVPMPLNHVFGLRRLQAGLVVGATVVLVNGVVMLKRFYKAIRDHHVTSLSLVPSALAYLERTTKNYLGKFSDQISFVESSSAPLPKETRKWLCSVLPKSRLYNSYGCTESTACCMLEYSKQNNASDTCVGTPCTTAHIVILDPTSGNEIKEGEGRIVIGGSGVMSGYLDDPAATAQTLKNSMVYTNDLGFFCNNELYIRGRIDNVAIVGGHNVSLEEVEELVSGFSGIFECACIKVFDKLSGDRLVLYAVWQKSNNISALRQELLEFLRRELEQYKIPSEILTIQHIPRTFNGKIDRIRLLGMYASDGAQERDI